MAAFSLSKSTATEFLSDICGMIFGFLESDTQADVLTPVNHYSIAFILVTKKLTNNPKQPITA